MRTGGNGFINVNDSERYALPDPIPFKENHAYSIAVFHQLHCLVSYRLFDRLRIIIIPILIQSSMPSWTYTTN